MPVVLHIAPHPDDELLGAGGTLVALADHGWDVVAFTCSLGRPEQHLRRRSELSAACAAVGFTPVVAEGPPSLSSGDDLALAEDDLADQLSAAIAATAPALVVGPGPHDAHPAHESVGRATFRALDHRGPRPRWWIWHLWGHAALPTLYVPLEPGVFDRVVDALRHHAGELARADYQRLVHARSEADAVLGAERVFGWGARAVGAARAELLTEILTDRDAAWPLAAARCLHPANPLQPASARGIDAGAWLQTTGPRASLLYSPTPTSTSRDARLGS
ncbi:MAG TPA: PIG-L family deacetylase [Solirubrobacteraceae bacterium]